jgi:hypothetical protein
MLADGYLAAGGAPEQMAMVPDEEAAIADVQRRMREGDLVLLMAAEPARAIELLRDAGGTDA